jgi:hypothetical protein
MIRAQTRIVYKFEIKEEKKA